MTKQNLIKILRKEFGFTWSDCERIIETILKSIKKELKTGGKVTLQNFGTFKTADITTRRFRNIHTGKIVTKLIKNKVKFKPSKNILQKN